MLGVAALRGRVTEAIFFRPNGQKKWIERTRALQANLFLLMSIASRVVYRCLKGKNALVGVPRLSIVQLGAELPSF